MVAIRRVCACFGLAPNATLREDFTYDAAGRRVSDARYDDLAASTLIARTTTTYDALGRILGLETRDASNTLVAEYAYAYDAAGRLTSKNDDGTLTTYSYDNTNQLTDEDAASDDRTYSYDANGNRTGAGIVVGADNRLLSDGTWDYVYDAEGNVTEKTDGAVTWTYAYDHRNQMTLAERHDTNGDVDLRAEYQYDVFGNRIAKTVDSDGDGPLPGETLRFVLDGWNTAKGGAIGNENWDVWADVAADGSLKSRYLRGDAVDELFGRADATPSGLSAKWPLADRLGSVRLVLAADGSVLDAIRYDAFGQIVSETDASERGRYAWTGCERDVETDLQYNRARYYDASIGRWTTQDPMGHQAGDANLNRYVHNRPVVATDPSGLDGPTILPSIGKRLPFEWDLPAKYKPDAETMKDFQHYWLEITKNTHGSTNASEQFRYSYDIYDKRTKQMVATGVDSATKHAISEMLYQDALISIGCQWRLVLRGSMPTSSSDVPIKWVFKDAELAMKADEAARARREPTIEPTLPGNPLYSRENFLDLWAQKKALYREMSRKKVSEYKIPDSAIGVPERPILAPGGLAEQIITSAAAVKVAVAGTKAIYKPYEPTPHTQWGAKVVPTPPTVSRNHIIAFADSFRDQLRNGGPKTVARLNDRARLCS